MVAKGTNSPYADFMATRRKAGPREVRAWRRKAGLSEASLGRRLGVSGSYIGKYERKERDLPIALKVKIHEFTNIPLQNLLTRPQLRTVCDAARLLPSNMIEKAA